MSTFEQKKSARWNGRAQKAEAAAPEIKNPDAERVVLATFMAHNGLFEVYSDRLKPTHFHEPIHRQIFDVGSRLVVENKPANRATVASQITELSPIPDLSVGEYLKKLDAFIKAKAEVEAYVLETILAAKRRAVLDFGERTVAKAPTADHDIIGTLSSEIAVLAGGEDNPGMRHMGQCFSDIFQDIMQRDADNFAPTGYLSGFHEIDDALGGFKKSKLYYIVANEKVGKSALALSLVRQFLLKDLKVAIFSLEMKDKEVCERLLIMESGINTVTRKKGQRLTDDEAVTLTEAANRLETWDFYCNDLATLTASAIVMNARHAVKVLKADVIVVDYLQIMNSEDDREETRKRVERASKALRQMAKELNVPVIALAQLNRKTLERASAGSWKDFKPDAARPRRGDIRESAQMEMDADAILAIYRPEVLFKELRPFDGVKPEDEIDFENTLRSYRGKAEISVILNRSGPDGVRCKCAFKADLGLFEPFPRKI